MYKVPPPDLAYFRPFLIQVVTAWVIILVIGQFARRFGKLYRMAMITLRSDPDVRAVFGVPEPGWWIRASRKRRKELINESGYQYLRFRIRGHGRRGRVTVSGERVFGEWGLSLLVVAVDGTSSPMVLVNTENLRIPGLTI